MVFLLPYVFVRLDPQTPTPPPMTFSNPYGTLYRNSAKFFGETLPRKYGQTAPAVTITGVAVTPNRLTSSDILNARFYIFPELSLHGKNRPSHSEDFSGDRVHTTSPHIFCAGKSLMDDGTSSANDWWSCIRVLSHSESGYSQFSVRSNSLLRSL